MWRIEAHPYILSHCTLLTDDNLSHPPAVGEDLASAEKGRLRGGKREPGQTQGGTQPQVAALPHSCPVSPQFRLLCPNWIMMSVGHSSSLAHGNVCCQVTWPVS